MTEAALDTSAVVGSERVGERFVAGELPVAVYGLGKMGLPLAAAFAETSGNVIGADIDPAVVETVNAGNCHVEREPGLAELVEDLVGEEALSATTDPRKAAKRASIHVVIVPTPITEEKEPDLSILDAVVDAIGAGLSTGDLVCIESTVPPQTTERRVLATLSERSGLSREKFGVAFCPERTSSGRALQDIRGAYPKVVGGVDEASTSAAAAIYEKINDSGVIQVSDATTAEAVKVFEGLYRDVNIALANELATFTDELGIDVREAIEIANTQPFCEILDPGPGVGGHCIPWYPYFMIAPFETEAPMLETAREVNDGMPRFTVEKVREELAAEGKELSEATVALMGLTYRPDVEEIRASPAIDIASGLSAAGATVFGVDPMIDSFEAFPVDPISISDLYEIEIDVAVLVTPHTEFDHIDWELVGASFVIDGRDTLDPADVSCRVYTIGSGEKHV